MKTAGGAKKGSSTAAREGRCRWHEEAELSGGIGTKTTVGTRGADFSVEDRNDNRQGRGGVRAGVEDRTMARAISGLFGSI
jgi:hypothetical protein